MNENFEKVVLEIMREEKIMLQQAGKFWQWVLTSSANPQEASLTVKGWMTTILPVLMFVAHNPNLNTLPDDVYSFVMAALGLVAGFMTVWGLARKIYLTVIGKPIVQ